MKKLICKIFGHKWREINPTKGRFVFNGCFGEPDYIIVDTLKCVRCQQQKESHFANLPANYKELVKQKKKLKLYRGLSI